MELTESIKFYVIITPINWWDFYGHQKTTKVRFAPHLSIWFRYNWTVQISTLKNINCIIQLNRRNFLKKVKWNYMFTFAHKSFINRFLVFLHKILYFRIEKNVKWDKVEHFPALAIREISNNIFLVLYAIKTIVLNSRVKRSFFFLILAHSALFQIDFPQLTLRERKEKVEKKLVQTRGKCKKARQWNNTVFNIQ